MSKAIQLYEIFQKVESWKEYWTGIQEALPVLATNYDFCRIFFSSPYCSFMEDEEADEREEVYVFPYDHMDYFWFLHYLQKEGVIDRAEYHQFLQNLPAKELNKILKEITRLDLDQYINPINVTIGSFLEEILGAVLDTASEGRLLRMSKNKVVAEKLFLLALQRSNRRALALLQDKIELNEDLLSKAVRSVGADCSVLEYLRVSDEKLMGSALFTSPGAVDDVARFLLASEGSSARRLFAYWYTKLQAKEKAIDEENEQVRAQKREDKANGKSRIYSYSIFSSKVYKNLFKGFLLSGLVPLYLLIEMGLTSSAHTLRRWAQKQQAKNIENV